MSDFTTENSAPRFRIAPTPSGYLHRGNMAAFLLTWAICKATNGTLLLRIDDLDRARFRGEYLEDIFRKLDACGITWEDGPSGPDNFHAVWSQRNRMDLYAGLLKRMTTLDALYTCTCSRNDRDTGKTCSCRIKPPASAEAALRFYTAKLTNVMWQDKISGNLSVNLNRDMPDFVLRKKDGDPAYQLTSLADDLHFQITDIVRGIDLMHSTAAQLHLATALREDRFTQIRFYHHALLQGQKGEKLSKSAGDGRIQKVTESAEEIPQLLRIIKEWTGLPTAVETREDLILSLQEKFSK